MKYLMLVLFLVLMSCNAEQSNSNEIIDQSNSTEFYPKLLQDLPKIKEYVLSLEPAIGETDNITEKARLISNFIYKQITLTQNRDGLSYYLPFNSLVKMVNNKDVGDLCGGISIFYRFVLMAFGIKSRYVALFIAVEGVNYNSHASAEFYDGEKWIASDATYNLVWLDELGNYLSYQDVFNRKVSGLPYTHEYNSIELIGGRTLEYQNLYYNTDDYFNYVAVFPSNDIDDHAYLSVIEGWDGWVQQPTREDKQWMNISQYPLFVQMNKAFTVIETMQ